MKKFYIHVVLAISLIFIFSSNVYPCSCGASSSVRAHFEGSDLVVIAKAVSVDLTEEAKGLDLKEKINVDGSDMTDAYVKSTRMRVERVFKGNVKVGDVLLFGQGTGANCIWTFGLKSIGESFLFYLDRPQRAPYGHPSKRLKKRAYYPSTCGRSESLSDYATDDLKYLNNLAKVRGKSRISGTLMVAADSGPSVSGVKIKIIGERSEYETRTDENGIYEIYDLPAGKYLIRPEMEKGWKINEFMLGYSPVFFRDQCVLSGCGVDVTNGVPLLLEQGDHNGIDFMYEADSSVKGRVLSPDGQPMKGVCVNAVSVNSGKVNHRGGMGCTNGDGSFFIFEIEPGDYFLVANHDGKISESEPFSTLFYGNTDRSSEAKSVKVNPGDHLDGVIIQATKLEEMVTVSGKMIYSNGTPVADGFIELTTGDEFQHVSTDLNLRTDKDGVFHLEF